MDSLHFRLSGAAILALGLGIVDSGALLYVMSVDVYHTWRAVGDLDAAGALLASGVLVFPIATVIACRRDGIRSPRVVDHLRQCAILYVVLAIFALMIWPQRSRDGGSLGFAAAALVASGAVIGLVANAITLGMRRALVAINSAGASVR